MKNFSAFLVIFSVMISFTACRYKGPVTTNGPYTSEKPGEQSEKPNNDKDPEGSLEDILKRIYDTADLPDNFEEYLKTGVETVQITDENMEWLLGRKGYEFKEAIASEPLIQPSTYSLCLVRVKDGTDVEKFKKEMRDSINPQKWICMSVKEENIIIDNLGDVIFLVMSDEVAKPLHDAFLALKG